jgi:hypothetical protein
VNEIILTAAMLAFISTAQAQGYVTQPGRAPAYAIPRGEMAPMSFNRRDIGPLTQSRAAMARMSFRDIDSSRRRRRAPLTGILAKR